MKLSPKSKDILFPPYLISRIVNIATTSSHDSYKDIYLSIEQIFEDFFAELNHEDLQRYFSNKNTLKELPELSIEDLKLYQKLSDLRHEIATTQNIEHFRILDNKTLRHLAQHKPTNKEEMIKIHGIKERKYQQYGELFLIPIKEFLEQNKIHNKHTNSEPSPDKERIQHFSNVISSIVNKISEPQQSSTNDNSNSNAYKERTHEEEQELKKLFQNGTTIDEISVLLNRSIGWIKARLIRLGLRERE